MDQVIEKLQNADTIMEVTDLCKFFKAGKKQVLKAVDHVTVSIKRGETLGLVGESGCGKTTCGRTMMKLYEPTSGKVVFDGKDISTLKGKDLLDREAKRRGLQLGVLMKDENLEPLLKKYAFSDAEDIYGAVGYGMIAAAYVITRLYEEQQKAEEAAAPKAPPALPEVGESAAARTGKPTQGIYVEGGSGMLVRFARCCNPVPGDDIVGYITRGRGVTVHKADCVNAQHSEPERAIRVSWAEESIGRFTTTIQVIAYDHPSLLGELTVFVQDGGAPISAMSVKISKNKTCTIQMEVQVESREKLDAVLARIRKRPDVIEAFRLGR